MWTRSPSRSFQPALHETGFPCGLQGFLIVKTRFRVVAYAQFPVEILDHDPFKNRRSVTEQQFQFPVKLFRVARVVKQPFRCENFQYIPTQGISNRLTDRANKHKGELFISSEPLVWTQGPRSRFDITVWIGPTGLAYSHGHLHHF